MRSAHTAFNIGDFSSVISYTSKAEKEARNKISDAETRDRREKKKRDDAAAAARRRRQRSYSSSSSSSFG